MTNRKRIALITLDYPPEKGGVARYLGNLVQASHGLMDVFVNETHRAGGPGHIEPAHLVQTPWPHWWPMVSFMRELRMREYGSVLVSQALPCGTAAWLAKLSGGLPYSVLMHGLDLRVALRSKRKSWLLRRILRGAKNVIANSVIVADEIRDFDRKIKPIIMTPGVEPLPFPERDPARRSLGIHDGTFQVLCVTRLVPRKGIDRLLEAMQLLPADVRLTIIGDGQDRERLLKLAEPLGERVSFLHELDDESRNAWYAASDAFALPVRDEGNDVEGFGIVFLEAALAGLPSVAGKSGGAVEAVIHEETGLHVEPNNSQEIAGAIQRLRADEALRRRLGEAGRRRVLQDFRWSDRWDKLSGLV
ncbi:glycosyltransferase family 4 protein [Patescibacteria group bacterium]|jgi:phosphatidylinositol alpha-1,6-mannosyltransferase|nr:glycosyltransferase family 4 protein [Patescibacteria group bacterium]